MYKFSNGVVVFTKEDRDNFVKAGYILVEEGVENAKKDNNDGVIEKEHRGNNKEVRGVQRGTKKWNK